MDAIELGPVQESELVQELGLVRESRFSLMILLKGYELERVREEGVLYYFLVRIVDRFLADRFVADGSVADRFTDPLLTE